MQAAPRGRGELFSMTETKIRRNGAGIGLEGTRSATSGLVSKQRRPALTFSAFPPFRLSVFLCAMPAPLLVPSLLASDHADLAAGARLAASLGLPWVHVDVMDGHFVPNLTFGPQTVAALRRRNAEQFLDVHLMLDAPQQFVEAFAKAGASLITVHVEPAHDVAATLVRIRALGCQCGLALNPGTPVETVEPFLAQVDLVLAMTVQPGFGGQAFRRDVLPKITQLATWRRERGLNFRLEVDGGVDLATGPDCRAAGADTLVMGTAFFGATDPVAVARAVAGW
jgi:ribulose-phosphate 3-epimerase